MNEFPGNNIKEAFEFSTQIVKEECANFDGLLEFLTKFMKIFNDEKSKLPYHINLIDELHANENAHSRILEKLLKQKTNGGTYELLESFVEYLKEKVDGFGEIIIEKPKITQEIQRIDLWIRDKTYAIIIENKVNWASDQQAQIERYIDRTRDHKFKESQIYVIYLAPTYEKDPEIQSWGKYYETEIRAERYMKLSFRDDIILWLREKVLPNIKIEDVYLRSAIEQYIDHLEGAFSLRTINNKMNMELQKFIEEKLALSEQRPEEALETILKKKEELQNAISQLKLVEEQYRINCFEAWEKQLKIDFIKNDIISDTKNKAFPKVGIKFQFKETSFFALIEYDYNRDNINYGIYTYANIKPKDPIVTDFVRVILSESFTDDPHAWWYFCEKTSFRNGFVRLKTLIEKIQIQLSKE
jgi:hypothetical protein